MAKKKRHTGKKRNAEEHDSATDTDRVVPDGGDDDADAPPLQPPPSPTPKPPSGSRATDPEPRPDALRKPPKLARRSLSEDLSYLIKLSPTRYRVNVGFVPNMIVPAEIIANPELEELLVEELRASAPTGEGGGGGFIPALRQMANVAALPGIVRASLAMPDVHSGYGFCIGNVAAFDMDDPDAVVSPGGVGFDINCGVRLMRTNLTEGADVPPGEVRERLAQALFDHIPVGVGTKGVIPATAKILDEVLLSGIDWALKEGYAWPEVRRRPPTAFIFGRRRGEGGTVARAVPNPLSQTYRPRECMIRRLSHKTRPRIDGFFFNRPPPPTPSPLLMSMTTG